MPHLGDGAIAVVREHGDHYGRATRAVALVRDLVELLVGARTRGLRDRALDVVVRHVAGLRALHRKTELEVRRWIGTTLLCGEDDLPGELGEDGSAPRI